MKLLYCIGNLIRNLTGVGFCEVCGGFSIKLRKNKGAIRYKCTWCRFWKP